jgi:catechol 2,3-dioxygenase-like lactoylglutathione lyase family enzyme
MFDHVTIRVSERAASERFYTLVLRELGREVSSPGPTFVEWGDFSIAQATGDKPPTRRLHLGFGARSREQVEAFWRAGVEAGYRSDGRPGPRPQYSPGYYGAFLLDPDGNSAEAVVHERTDTRSVVDHLWIRVADLASARRFYATIAPHAALQPGADGPDRVQFRVKSVSFSLVPGDAPTEHLHLAFPGERVAVDAFHAAATAAGYADNGAPGERPEYSAGYYGAFVCDPDGNNIEVVSHG